LNESSHLVSMKLFHMLSQSSVLIIDYVTFWCVLIIACCDLVGRRVGGEAAVVMQRRIT